MSYGDRHSQGFYTGADRHRYVRLGQAVSVLLKLRHTRARRDSASAAARLANRHDTP